MCVPRHKNPDFHGIHENYTCAGTDTKTRRNARRPCSTTLASRRAETSGAFHSHCRIALQRAAQLVRSCRQPPRAALYHRFRLGAGPFFSTGFLLRNQRFGGNMYGGTYVGGNAAGRSGARSGAGSGARSGAGSGAEPGAERSRERSGAELPSSFRRAFWCSGRGQVFLVFWAGTGISGVTGGVHPSPTHRPPIAHPSPTHRPPFVPPARARAAVTNCDPASPQTPNHAFS